MNDPTYSMTDQIASLIFNFLPLKQLLTKSYKLTALTKRYIIVSQHLG